MLYQELTKAQVQMSSEQGFAGPAQGLAGVDAGFVYCEYLVCGWCLETLLTKTTVAFWTHFGIVTMGQAAPYNLGTPSALPCNVGGSSGEWAGECRDFLTRGDHRRTLV